MIKHFQRAIGVRLKNKGSVALPVLASWDALIAYEFFDFPDSGDARKWIKSITRQVASSPGPEVRGAAKILRVSEAAAHEWAGAKS